MTGEDTSGIFPKGSAPSDSQSSLVFSNHEAILQTLDRASKGIFLNKEAFEPTVGDWDKVPLIFTPKIPADHPNPDAYDKDPEAELKRIGGRLLDGHAKGTYIDGVGHPKLRTEFIINDAEVKKGIADGRISTSNGMRVPNNGNKLTGTVQPHHILFFYEEGGAVPGDKGAFILNTSTETQDEALSLIDKLKALFVKGGTKPEGASGGDGSTMTENEIAGKLAVAESKLAEKTLAFTQLEAKVGELTEQVKAKDAEITKLKADNLAFTTREKDGKWQRYKDKYVPPGMLEGDKEASLRAEFEADPLTFSEKIMEARSQVTELVNDTGAEPVMFTAKRAAPGAKLKTFEEELAAMGVPSASFER